MIGSTVSFTWLDGMSAGFDGAALPATCSAFLHSFASWRFCLASSSMPFAGMPIQIRPNVGFSKRWAPVVVPTRSNRWMRFFQRSAMCESSFSLVKIVSLLPSSQL
ncbi:MAG: hypothetical protein JWR65_4283 [Massilia sp.]|nr:hypothetical protein [Massilia sp.]